MQMDDVWPAWPHLPSWRGSAMQVTLKLMGFQPLLDSEGVMRDGPLVLSVPDDATVIDRLRELAAAYGSSFEVERFLSGTRLSGVSVFAGSELIADPATRLADMRLGDDITVSVLRPVAGG